MRTIFTIEDVKDIVEKIFNGNLAQHKLSKGAIPYENKNSEQILLIDQDNGDKKEIDLAEYLNIRFYNWKERLVSRDDRSINEDPALSVFETWVQSLNFSMNEAYALVEKLDEEVTASQDIDSSTITGKVTFLIQADKVKNLDYYVTKVRNSFLGVPQDIQNSFGDKIKAFIMIGALSYDQEPFTMQLGECMIVSLNFRISYLNDALTYSDAEIQISLDGDDEYDENGVIQGETKYLTMPISKATFQRIFTSNALPMAGRPDLTGFIATALSNATTFTFFDFNKELSRKLNTLFWQTGAYRIDGQKTNVRNVNIPIYIKVIIDGHSYVYKDMIDNMQKSLTNNDFNISSITTKGWGKIEQ